MITIPYNVLYICPYFIYLLMAALGLGSCVGFLQVRRVGATLWWRCVGFSLPRLLLFRGTGSGAHGLQELWCTGFVAPQHVGSSWTRGRTHDPSIGSQPVNHWTTRDVLCLCSFSHFLQSLFFFYIPYPPIQIIFLLPQVHVLNFSLVRVCW